MPELVETVDVDAPPERVWAVLTDWVRQGEWMLATDVRDRRRRRRRGSAAGWPRAPASRCPAAGTLGVLDTMVITTWEPPRLVEVQHTGRVIRGHRHLRDRSRAVSAPPSSGPSVLDLPLGALGRAGWPAVRPAMRAGVRLSLRGSPPSPATTRADADRAVVPVGHDGPVRSCG